MTNWQLAWVLVGGTLAVVAIGMLVLGRRRGGEPARSTEPPETLQKVVHESPVRHEPPEQQSARLEALRKLQAIAFGTPLGPVAAAAASQDPRVTAIRLTLAGIADKPNYAPRRPMLLPRLMRAMNDNEVSRRELARIIATDPALAGSLVRLANSPFYRIRLEPVESLDRAIALLGLEGMRSLISAALLQPVFRVSGGLFAQFGDVTWEHTLYSAAAAEAHAAILENSDPFAAQLLSLLMGLATIVVFRVATDEFMSRALPPDPSLLAALIDSETTSVARLIAASWELSERIDAALADQLAPADVQHSALGRSLQVGRFLGALALLHTHGVMTEDEVQAALATGGAAAGAYERIWSRVRASA